MHGVSQQLQRVRPVASLRAKAHAQWEEVRSVATKKTGGSGAGKPRSAITGRYVTRATAARHPRTTVVEAPASRRSGKK